MIINSGDSEFKESALLRTKVALAGLTDNSHQDPKPSVVNMVLKSVPSNDKMDH